MFSRFSLGSKTPAKSPASNAASPTPGTTNTNKVGTTPTAASTNKQAIPSTPTSTPVAIIPPLLLTISTPQVHYCDLNGYWEPLSQLYFSSTCHKLVSKHKESAVEDIVSFYCPACITRYMEDEVALYQNECPVCKECPICTATLVVSSDKKGFFYECGYCSWKSIALLGPDKANLEEAIANKYKAYSRGAEFKVLVDSYQVTKKKSEPLTKGRRKGDPQWKVEDIETRVAEQNKRVVFDPVAESKLYQRLKTKPASLEPSDTSAVASTSEITTAQQRLHYATFGPAQVNELLPLAVRFKTKRMVRCRQDVLDGALSIVLQPKAFPLEGDSSHKLQKGKWWVKNACAVTEFPTIVLRKLPDLKALAKGESSFLHATLFNLRESAVRVQLTQLSPEEVLAKEKDYRNVQWLQCEPREGLVAIGAHEDELLMDTEDLAKLASAQLAPESSDASAWSIVTVVDTAKICVSVKLDSAHAVDKAVAAKAVHKIGFKMRVYDSAAPDKPLSAEDLIVQIMF